MRRKKSLFCWLRIDGVFAKIRGAGFVVLCRGDSQCPEANGLHKKEIQGLSITTQVSPDYSPHVAEQLGLEVDWVLNGDYGGAGGVMSVRRAADAIEAGHVELIVLVGANLR